jgi:hypothetical protein
MCFPMRIAADGKSIFGGADDGEVYYFAVP